MTNARMVAISFPAFLKFNALTGAAGGLLLGALYPIGEMIGFRMVAGVEAPWLTGLGAWLVYLIAFPLVCSILSLAFSLVSFIPFSLILRWAGGIAVRISETREESRSVN